VSIGSDFIGDLNFNLAATTIEASNCASLTSLSAPSATYIYANNCASLTSLSAPSATTIEANNCTSLTSLSAPLATDIYANNCASLTSLSAPSATTVYASNCPALSAQSIYDALDNAYTLALGDVTDGVLDFGGTTVFPNSAVISPIHEMTYENIVVELEDASWTVSF
jgi:hypothetical protein